MPIIYILGMADIFTSDDNSTPLTPEEREGLKPKWITLRRELNEFETRNILMLKCGSQLTSNEMF